MTEYFWEGFWFVLGATTAVVVIFFSYYVCLVIAGVVVAVLKLTAKK